MLASAAAIELAAAATTRFGRQIYLIGSNREAARLSGLPVAGVTFACYVISGLFAALGGIAVLARSGVSSTFTGRGFEFDALAADRPRRHASSAAAAARVVGSVAGTLVLFIAFNLVNIVGLQLQPAARAEGRDHHRGFGGLCLARPRPLTRCSISNHNRSSRRPP